MIIAQEWYLDILLLLMKPVMSLTRFFLAGVVGGMAGRGTVVRLQCVLLWERI